jgi:arginine-tRNA-protein transferase
MATSSDESSTGTFDDNENDASTGTTSQNKNSVRLYGSAMVECGYCKGARSAHVDKEPTASSKAYSILADRLEAGLYEEFLKAGWRRSGNALYQPDNWESCCPALTIRMAVAQFVPTKSQRKVARQMKRLLDGPSLSTTSATASTTASSSHQQQHGTAASRVAQSRRSRQEQMVQESGMIDRLQEWTEALLSDVLQQQQQPLTKTPSAAVSFKMQPARKKKTSDATSAAVKEHEHHEPTTTVTVYTTVCAAVAGQSQGKIDRTDLAERLAQALLQKSNSTSMNSTGGTTTDDSDSGLVTTATPVESSHHKKHRTEPLATTETATARTSNVTIHSMQAHAASGQVLVELNVPVLADDYPSITMKAKPHTSTSMDTTDTTMTTADDTDNTSKADDRLQAWLLSVRKKSPHHPTTPTEQQQPEQSPLPQPPYDLTVTTLPAHESVLDPDVHQLYFLYQHKIHDDPDPYDTTTATAASHSNDVDDDDKDSDNDRGSAFDSKWAGHAPVGWLESARTMLKNEYRHLPTSQLERIAKSFVSFYEFLVENPFTVDNSAREENNGGTNRTNSKSQSKLPPPTGTYHQHYRLANGVLIAVGVVDVLPHGLSSVYLFYDPTFSHDLVPLGKYAILREIEWTQQAGLPYYYLGYYIESCPKMRYKADYHPSELLCPTTHQWVNAEEAKATILRDSPRRHCCTLYQNKGGGSSTPAPPAVDNTASIVQEVRMEVGIDTPVTIHMLQPQGQTLVKPYLSEFVKKAGRDISLQCIVNFR